MDPTDKAAARVAARKTQGARLRALRAGLGMTQEALGALVGQSRVEINHLENGRRGLVHHDVRTRFAEGVGLPMPVFDGYLAGEVSEAVAVRMATEVKRSKEAA